MAAKAFDRIHSEFTPEFSFDRVRSDRSVILNNEEDIGALITAARSLLRPLRVREITISIDGLPATFTNDIQIQLNDYLRECGCHSGSIAGALGVLTFPFLLIALTGWPPSWRWRYLLFGILFCFGMAMLGKAWGLVRARVKFVRKLESLWELFTNSTVLSRRMDHGQNL